MRPSAISRGRLRPHGRRPSAGRTITPCGSSRKCGRFRNDAGRDAFPLGNPRRRRWTFPKNSISIWYEDKDAEGAARFYAQTFPDSKVTAVRIAPGDFPSGKAGDVLTVEFTVFGIPCVGLNGGPGFKQT